MEKFFVPISYFVDLSSVAGMYRFISLHTNLKFTFSGKACQFEESVLLVGETGCGKTTVCQLLAALNDQQLFSVNCHQHSESSDFLGALRPVRDRSNQVKIDYWLIWVYLSGCKTGESRKSNINTVCGWSELVSLIQSQSLREPGVTLQVNLQA